MCTINKKPNISDSIQIITSGPADDRHDQRKKQFRDWADHEQLPGLAANKTYQIYFWKTGTFGHHSVVIGSEESKLDNIGYVTMELRKNGKVYADSTFIEKKDSLDYIESGKWEQHCDEFGCSWNWEVKTTMKALIELSEDLINEHGTYSAWANSCQDFVKRFLKKCADKEKKYVQSTKTATEKILHLVH